LGHEGRIALVTGASRGIGAAIASRLAQAGFRVIVNHRASAEAAEEVVRLIRESGGQAEVEQADVTDMTAVRAMITRIRSRHGRLDVLVNNAGRSEDGLLLLQSPESWWAVVRDNLSSVVNCSRAALPLLLEQKGGAIVNISSVSGLRGVEGQTAYCAAKAAVIGFTRALAKELASKGLSINCVAPGPIDTELYRKVTPAKAAARLAQLPLGRLGRSDEVAEVVALLAEGRATFVHGQTFAVDGGSTC
jgi:3-oxoacyl-[acyl-carrier protein] reductase